MSPEITSLPTMGGREENMAEEAEGFGEKQERLRKLTATRFDLA